MRLKTNQNSYFGEFVPFGHVLPIPAMGTILLHVSASV